MARQAVDAEWQAKASQRQTVWQIRSGAPLAGVALGARSAARGWRMLLAVALGMIITVMLLSAVPIYSALIAAAQIRHELISATPTDRNIEVTAHMAQLEDNYLKSLDAKIQSARKDTLPPGLIGVTGSYAEIDHMFTLTKINGHSLANPEVFPTFPRSGQLDFLAFNYTQAAPYMKLLAGRLPKPTPAGAPLEVMVTPKFGAQPGALLTVPVDASGDTSHEITARVVGVWYPKDVNDPFWNGHSFDTVYPTSPILSPSNPPAEFPLLFDRDSLVSALATPLQPVAPRSSTGITLHAVWLVNIDSIGPGNVESVAQDVKQLRGTLNGQILGTNLVDQIGVATHLSDILSGGQSIFGLLRQPLYSVAAELVAMALLFIFTMVGIFVESQAGVIATLRSRGASMTQVLVSYLTQGLALAVLALIVGPLAATALSLALIGASVPSARSGPGALSVAYIIHQTPVRQALVPATAGASLALLAVILAAWQAARLDILAFRRRQGRGERAPFWRRYYLDFGLAALVIAGYVQLATFGQVTTRALVGAIGGSGLDLIQTVTPTLTLIVGALLILRVAPWLLRLGAWLTHRGRGATGMLALSQVARASGPFNRLTLLLALSVGVGLFALSYQTTIARASVDQAYYLAGADERVMIKPPEEGTQLTGPYRAKFAQMPGVQGVTPLYRSYGFTSSNYGSQNVDMLGVDPGNIAQVIHWRADYANEPLTTLMGALKRDERGANAGDDSHPIAALVNGAFAQTLSLSIGSQFALTPRETLANLPLKFVVVGLINDFPTMYNEYPAGYIVVNINDYLAALGNPVLSNYSINGPNEYLLATTPDPVASAHRAHDLANPNYFVDSTLDARSLERQYRADPLSAGISGLLLAGAIIVSLLALLGVLVQAAVASRRRGVQFAVLRTFGMSGGALVRMLLVEQLLVYVLGALGGVGLAALLAYAALPFLGFSSATYRPPELDVPTIQLTLNTQGTVTFLVALLVAFALALALAGMVARSMGLGSTLRIGED